MTGLYIYNERRKFHLRTQIAKTKDENLKKAMQDILNRIENPNVYLYYP